MSLQTVLFQITYYLDPAKVPGHGIKNSETYSQRAISILEGLDHTTPILSDTPPFTTTYRYFHQDTQVECLFKVLPSATKKTSYSPKFYELGLTFSLKLPSPTFFALEALPLAVSVAREMRAYCAITEPFVTHPHKPTVESLLEHWTLALKQAIKELTSQHKAPPICPPNKTEHMWEYMLLRRELIRRYTPKGIPVPAISLIQRKKNGLIHRCADWDGLRPTVIPDVEWLRLVNPPKPLKHNTYYELTKIDSILKPWFRDIPHPIYHRLCEKNLPDDELIALLLKAPRLTQRSFRPLEYHEVIDLIE